MKYNSGIKKSVPFFFFLSLFFTGAFAQNQSTNGSDVSNHYGGAYFNGFAGCPLGGYG